MDQYDLSHLRCAVSAGEPLNQEVIETFQRQFDITIRDGYGQTESTLIIASLKDIPSRPGSMGKAIAPGIVEVIDKDGNPLPPEVVGDIAVHLSMKELQSHIKEWTAPYKYPRKIEFIRELPKTSSGKIRRIELREMENGTVQN